MRRLTYILLLLAFAGCVYADSVQLEWDASTGADGYRLWWGAEQNVYTNSQDVGANLTGTIDITTGTWISVTAYNAEGESDFAVPIQYGGLSPRVEPATGVSATEDCGGPVMAWPGDWGRKVVITIQASLADGTLAYFPVLLTEATMPTEVLDTTSGNKAQSDGGDLRFYTGDYSASDPATEDTDRIPCEIVSFTQGSGSGTAEIYVRIPSINSSTGATITMYYNATGKSQPAEGASYGKHATWDENGAQNYWLVAHLEESSGTLYDATGNSKDSTTSSGVTYAQTGKEGKCLSFDGSNDYIVFPAEQTDYQTVTAWVYPDLFTGNRTIFQHWNYVGGGDRDRQLVYGNSGKLYFEAYDSGAKTTNGSTNFSTGTWGHVGYIITGTQIGVISNGEVEGLATGNGYNSYGSGPVISVGHEGDAHYDSNYLDGLLDEIRYATTNRSNAWIAAEYRSVNAPGTYVVEGTPMDVAAGGGLSIPVAMRTYRNMRN